MGTFIPFPEATKLLIQQGIGKNKAHETDKDVDGSSETLQHLISSSKNRRKYPKKGSTGKKGKHFAQAV
jgi:hypothetical protein